MTEQGFRKYNRARRIMHSINKLIDALKPHDALFELIVAMHKHDPTILGMMYYMRVNEYDDIDRTFEIAGREGPILLTRESINTLKTQGDDAYHVPWNSGEIVDERARHLLRYRKDLLEFKVAFQNIEPSVEFIDSLPTHGGWDHYFLIALDPDALGEDPPRLAPMQAREGTGWGEDYLQDGDIAHALDQLMDYLRDNPNA